MKQRHFRHGLAVLAAAFGLALLAAPLAHAFTFENESTSNPDGTSKFSDPEQQVSHFSGQGSGQTTIREGNTTLTFGPRDSGDRYSTDHLFDPIGHPTGER
jgi:hypothetical protein